MEFEAKKMNFQTEQGFFKKRKSTSQWIKKIGDEF